MTRISAAALLLVATPALAAEPARVDIVAGDHAALDTVNSQFMEKHCGGNPLSLAERDRTLGIILKGGWQFLVRQKEAALQGQVKTDGVERVCAALRAVY